LLSSVLLSSSIDLIRINAFNLNVNSHPVTLGVKLTASGRTAAIQYIRSPINE
jgi:hypothetical protein